MIDKEEILNEFNKVFDKYDGFLWRVIRRGVCYSDPYEGNMSYSWKEESIYIGSRSDVERVLSLKYLSGSYSISKPYMSKALKLEFIDAIEEYDKAFIPKQTGDIVKYKGEIYNVVGFCGNGIGLSKTNECTSGWFTVSNNEPIELIHSEYWKNNKR